MLNVVVNQSAITNNFQTIYKNFAKEEIGITQMAKAKVEDIHLTVSPLHSEINVRDYLKWIGEMKDYSTVPAQ